MTQLVHIVKCSVIGKQAIISYAKRYSNHIQNMKAKHWFQPMIYCVTKKNVCGPTNSEEVHFAPRVLQVLTVSEKIATSEFEY